MNLQEHLDESPRLKTWYEGMTAGMKSSAEEGFSHFVSGWPDEAHGFTHGEYLEHCDEVAHDLFMEKFLEMNMDIHHGDDMPSITVEFATFKQWKEGMREANPDRDDLGFYNYPCELCWSPLAGDRYAVTALPRDPAKTPNYETFRVCSDCHQFIANGQLPEE